MKALDEYILVVLSFPIGEEGQFATIQMKAPNGEQFSGYVCINTKIVYCILLVYQNNSGKLKQPFVEWKL